MAHGKRAEDGSVAAFEERLRGELLSEGNDGYDEARTVWNGTIDRKPELVARPTGAADVVAAVDFARETDRLVSVKGGGHSVAGSAVCEGGLMIDLSGMREVRVDPTARTVRVGPGATLGDMDHETQAFGLATPGGVVSTTGVAGLTLGGGFGWLSRRYGLAADNLRAAEIVTADGSVVTASEDESPDLFWAIRGGSGNFGVVTSFEFDLHEVGPEVLFGPVVYPYEDAADVLRHYRDGSRNAPNECCIWADSIAAPPLPFLSEDVHGTLVLVLMQAYVGDLEEGERVLQPFREYGDPIADAVAPVPYAMAQRTFDDLLPPGARNYWKSHNYMELTDTTLDAVVEYAERAPTPQSEILIHQVGGVINDVAPDATAYPHRETEFIITPGARWEDPAMDEECIAWVRACHDALAEDATGGTYVNFEGEREGHEHNAYGENYDRLVEVKTEYDPANLFRVNQNVEPPMAGSGD
ncbi:FAD-linked oxidase [Natronococcus pandeyae]|uniref:FAD-linked oxidase n=1 Tax=Natronococcus pandeyae TaxID=2055836 RepID=A0A8J8Q232_9EURY|nr:FAD-binding oxidoreductase [Natronococcus pandeyae]TYL37474.1 FAD-linked oxidase [Natronococcus pandeyae]